MGWTEDKVSKLKELWGKGNTASQIAEKIDVSAGEPFLTPTQKGVIDLAEKKVRDLRDV